MMRSLLLMSALLVKVSCGMETPSLEDMDVLPDETCDEANETCALSLRQLRVQRHSNEVAFETNGHCDSWCHYEPSSTWYTQTNCCGCHGGKCPCSCGPQCANQPSSVWYTQTGCCGCHKLIQTGGAVTEEQLEIKKEKLEVTTSCDAWCQYSPSSAWATTTSCCGCNGGKCACQCQSYCHNQPSAAWSTQTACCGCHSLLEEQGKEVVEEHEDGKSDDQESEQALVTEADFKTNGNCDAWCQYEPASSMFTQTSCCGCNGGKCKCACASYCANQPSSAWFTQTACCGCHSLIESGGKVTEVALAVRSEKEEATATCAAWCQYQPSSAWATQTGCCGCKGGKCACTCQAFCHYQPSSAWSTQTSCCGCHSLLEVEDEADEEEHTASVAKFEETVQGNCESYCQYEPAVAQATQTACCGCGGKKCSCTCSSYCQYQPQSVWGTNMQCCGCKR